TSAYFDTSTRTAATAPSKPSREISDAAASACSRLMSAIMTFAPSRTNFRTVARPIPLAPPVMSATLPSRRMGSSSLCVGVTALMGRGRMPRHPPPRVGARSAELVRRGDVSRVLLRHERDVDGDEALRGQLAGLAVPL